MGQTIRISSTLIEQAKLYKVLTHRSTAKQIEHWAFVGKVAEEHPDLPFNFIQDILVGLAELRAGKKEPYTLSAHV